LETTSATAQVERRTLLFILYTLSSVTIRNHYYKQTQAYFLHKLPQSFLLAFPSLNTNMALVSCNVDLGIAHARQGTRDIPTYLQCLINLCLIVYKVLVVFTINYIYTQVAQNNSKFMSTRFWVHCTFLLNFIIITYLVNKLVGNPDIRIIIFYIIF
jgi:hypothetical protein